MTLVKWIAASAAMCILVLAAAAGSNVLLDRFGLAREPSGPCLGEDGAPRNWPWANAPTLWPECPSDPRAPARER